MTAARDIPDPSYGRGPERVRKPKPAPGPCGCGKDHFYIDHEGRKTRCGMCCSRHPGKGETK